MLGVYYRPRPKETIPIGEAQLDTKLYGDFSLDQLVTSFKAKDKRETWAGDDGQFRRLIQAALCKDASKRLFFCFYIRKHKARKQWTNLKNTGIVYKFGDQIRSDHQ